jgi:hypothetical protein
VAAALGVGVAVGAGVGLGVALGDARAAGMPAPPQAASVSEVRRTERKERRSIITRG